MGWVHVTQPNFKHSEEGNMPRYNLETFKKLNAKKLKEFEGAISDFFTFIFQFLTDVFAGFSRANQQTKQTRKR
jgi:hypothetical protein